MTKQLFEEALADVKKVKQVAEDNAKRALIEAVTPRIRDLIDRALLEEDASMDAVTVDNTPKFPDPNVDQPEAGTNVVVDIAAAASQARPDVVTPPDADGKVTLDIDALCSNGPSPAVPPPVFGASVPAAEEYEISMESVDVLKPLVAQGNIDNRIKKVVERINRFKGTSKAIQATPTFYEQITQMISLVENMYEHVQTSITDPAKKGSYETTLEASFKDLNKLQESTTMSQKKRMMNEEDVTLKLTGLPDDIDLDTVGVDLITGDEEGEEGLDVDDGSGDDMDLDGLDLGDQGQDDEGEDMQMGESRRLSDDTVVEIDENMLRREIARMKNLREETEPAAWGDGPDHFDSFGGGKSEGEPTDAEIVDKSDAPAALPLGEADDVDMEDGQDDLDESDVVEAPPPAEVRAEGIKRLAFEKKLQERAQARGAALKKAAQVAKARGNQSKLSEIKKEYALVGKRFNESVARAKKTSQTVAAATRQLQETRSNSASKQPAENKAVNNTLRKKLAETNLFNAKLLYTNKLLQNEQLTRVQKAQVIKHLDAAKTVQEAKLVYESLATTLAAGTSRSVNESRTRAVLGSGSRAARPASSQSLNEGYEAERWAKLAGIVK